MTEPPKAVEQAGGTARPALAATGSGFPAPVPGELVVSADGPFTLISSRKPDDLPAFCQELVSQVGKD